MIQSAPQKASEARTGCFVVKSPPQDERLEVLAFDEKTMWRGKTIAPGDEVFLFSAEHHGGRGLFARGVVLHAVRDEGIRVKITVRRTDLAKRPLGRTILRTYRGGPAGDPGAEIDHKLYEQATNKIAGVSQAAARFLRGFF